MIRETPLGGWLRLPASVASPEHFGSKCCGVKGITFAAAVRFGSNDLLLQASMHELEDARPYCHLVIHYISFRYSKYARRSTTRPHANRRPMYGVIQAPPLFAYMQAALRLPQRKESGVQQGSTVT